MATAVDREISRIQVELAEVRQAKTDVLKAGQEMSLTGSHTFKGVSYETLCRRESALVGKLARLQGARNDTLPDFS